MQNGKKRLQIQLHAVMRGPSRSTGQSCHGNVSLFTLAVCTQSKFHINSLYVQGGADVLPVISHSQNLRKISLSFNKPIALQPNIAVSLCQLDPEKSTNWIFIYG